MARTTTNTRRTWLVAVLSVLALALGPVAAASPAQDVVAPSTAQAPAATPVSSETPASTASDQAVEQVATAVADTLQQAPVNVAVAVQVLSPGNAAPVTQANVATADAAATNVAAATSAPSGDAAAPAATTGQNATAVAQTTQIAPANVYIPVSILSPGDHGPVTQINVAGAQALATNAVQAAQQAGDAAAAGLEQVAGAVGAAAQDAPTNFTAPVTVGGVDLGDHPASDPWVWSWVWELDCGAGALPPVADLRPIIAQVTGGAWEWDWTWSCRQGGGAAPATGTNALPGAAPGASPAGTTAPGAQSDLTPAVLTPTPAIQSEPGARSDTRAAAAAGTGGQPFALDAAPALSPLGEARTSLGPTSAAGSARQATTSRSGGRASTPRAPSRPPGAPPQPAPTLFAAGAVGGSGPGPLSIGLAALIGAFCLCVPRLGMRARTALVHRSPQAVPGRKRRPG